MDSQSKDTDILIYYDKDQVELYEFFTYLKVSLKSVAKAKYKIFTIKSNTKIGKIIMCKN